MRIVVREVLNWYEKADKRRGDDGDESGGRTSGGRTNEREKGAKGKDVFEGCMRLFYVQTQEPTGRTLGRGPTTSRRDNRKSERDIHLERDLQKKTVRWEDPSSNAARRPERHRRNDSARHTKKTSSGCVQTGPPQSLMNVLS